jgi:RNA polymerase sigma-70 factor, ECF subfamily
MLAGRLFDLRCTGAPTAAQLAETAALLEGAAARYGTPSEDARLAQLDEACRGSLEAERVSPDVLLAALRGLSLEDLALGLACASGDRQALAAFERDIIEPVPRALVRLRPAARLVDEVRQELRQKLLVGDEGSRPKILDYKGRGPLGAWVRVVAMRIAYTLLRDSTKDDRAADVDAFEGLADGGDAADVAHFKQKYATEVKAAFEEVVSSLAPETRAVLRAHAVDGLTIDQIGALYQVHRSTAARWVQQAKGTMLDALRGALHRRLGVEAAACDSIVMLVQSRIDLSLDRVFDDGPDASSS